MDDAGDGQVRNAEADWVRVKIPVEGFMRNILCVTGLVMIFFASFLWIASSPNGPFSLSVGEFLTLLGLGAFMLLPQIIFQARQFFSSGSSDESPF